MPIDAIDFIVQHVELIKVMETHVHHVIVVLVENIKEREHVLIVIVKTVEAAKMAMVTVHHAVADVGYIMMVEDIAQVADGGVAINAAVQMTQVIVKEVRFVIIIGGNHIVLFVIITTVEDIIVAVQTTMDHTIQNMRGM